MKRSSSVQFGESAGRATAVAHRAARVLHEPSTKTQGGMERADEPAKLQHSVVFPPPPLVARVIVGPVPEVAPASLAGFLESVVDDEGRVVDWRLDRERPYVASDLMDYAEWRGSWERTWELGPLTNLRSLSASSVSSRTSPAWRRCSKPSSPTPKRRGSNQSTLPDLPAELDAVRAAIAGTARSGNGDRRPDPAPGVRLSASHGRGALRRSRSCSPPTRRRASSSIPSTGWSWSPGRRVPDASSMWSRPTCGATSWWSRTASVKRIELEGAAARPLAWIVPTSLRWKVRPIPQVVVWSALFSRLPDALRVAAAMVGSSPSRSIGILDDSLRARIRCRRTVRCMTATVALDRRPLGRRHARRRARPASRRHCEQTPRWRRTSGCCTSWATPASCSSRSRSPPSTSSVTDSTAAGPLRPAISPPHFSTGPCSSTSHLRRRCMPRRAGSRWSRRHDRWQLSAELRRSRAADSDAGLVDGAIALLAAVVELSARRRGHAPELMAERLCLAASSPQPTRTPVDHHHRTRRHPSQTPLRRSQRDRGATHGRPAVS